MKKICKLFLCIGLLFMTFGCSKPKVDDEALDQLISAVKKFSELTSFDYTIGIDIPVKDVKAELYGSCLLDGPQFSMMLDMDAEGQKLEKFIEFYFVDNTMYASFMGMKQRQKVDNLEDVLNISVQGSLDDINKEEMKKMVKEASINGNKLRFVIKDEFLKDSIEKGETDLSQLDIQEVTSASSEIELEDGFIKSAKITAEGLSNGKKTTVSTYLELGDINKKESISFPKDMKEWPLKADTDQK